MKQRVPPFFSFRRSVINMLLWWRSLWFRPVLETTHGVKRQGASLSRAGRLSWNSRSLQAIRRMLSSVRISCRDRDRFRPSPSRHRVTRPLRGASSYVGDRPSSHCSMRPSSKVCSTWSRPAGAGHRFWISRRVPGVQSRRKPRSELARPREKALKRDERSEAKRKMERREREREREAPSALFLQKVSRPVLAPRGVSGRGHGRRSRRPAKAASPSKRKAPSSAPLRVPPSLGRVITRDIADRSSPQATL